MVFREKKTKKQRKKTKSTTDQNLCVWTVGSVLGLVLAWENMYQPGTFISGAFLQLMNGFGWVWMQFE